MTHLRLDLTRTANVRLSVFDVVGRLVRTVAEGRFPAGPREWIWTGTDESGRRVAPGLYRARALIDGVPLTRSVVQIR